MGVAVLVKPFIFTIEIIGSQSFTLPLPPYGIYDFVINWGDNWIDEIKNYDDKTIKHTYDKGGRYIITIDGICDSWSFGHIGDRTYITEINDFGEVGWINLSNAFAGCTNLIKIEGSFNGLSEVVTLEGCFSYCRFTSIPTGLFDYCTKATNLNAVFYQCDALTSIPTDLFKNCTEAKNFVGAFCGCTELQNIPDRLFDATTKVTSFDCSFSNCEKILTAPTLLFKNYTNDISIRNTFYKTKLQVTPIPGAVEDIIEP